MPLLPISVILEVLAYIYLPGRSILMMLYPTGSTLRPVEALLASVALSLSITSLIALVLSLYFIHVFNLDKNTLRCYTC